MLGHAKLDGQVTHFGRGGGHGYGTILAPPGGAVLGASRLGFIYLARFQVTVPVPPADTVWTVYFSSSPAMTKGRFCSVLFQFGNVALSTWNVKLLSASLTT